MKSKKCVDCSKLQSRFTIMETMPLTHSVPYSLIKISHSVSLAVDRLYIVLHLNYSKATNVHRRFNFQTLDL